MYKTKIITAANQWTDALGLIGFFNYSAQGTFVATVTLQRSFDQGTTWEDVDSDTSSFSLTGFEAIPPFKFCNPSVLYRIGVKTGEFTSGSISVRIGIQ